MRKVFLSISTIFICFAVSAQLLSWSPQFPSDVSSITITVDATQGNQGLMGVTAPVYLHLGLITSASKDSKNWQYTSTTWGTTTAPMATSLGNNKWSFTITSPRTYFNAANGGVPVGETILSIAMLFRNADGSKVQRNFHDSDLYVPIYPAASNHSQIINPKIIPYYKIEHEPVVATINQTIAATAVASSKLGTLNMYFNGTKVVGPLTAKDTITANPVITVAGNQVLVSELVIAGVSYYDSVKFYVAPAAQIAPLPAGVAEGINYGTDCTSATLVLFAPNKSSAAVIGDFAGSNWAAQSQFQMNKTPDGNYYWLTITGLTSGTEYAYQYLVDNAIYIADPYAEKILDPYNDPSIPAATYPNLMPYPVNTNVTAGKNGIVSVLQPCATAYTWKTANYVRPEKRNLVTYELLVRDFGAARNYQMLIDSIGYFKSLGINAIELMPVNEFTGNDSWGYNPTFYCALDKAYGTKNKYKEFIDLCHQNGIAVIMDVVYNQMDAYSNPEGKLYWDAAANAPAANSPWFNQTAPHPYSVFNDLNHTSTATQYLVERSMDYWLSEFKIDGFRLDLAKGFTQTQSDGSTVENYDASRVANLNRYYDYVIAKYPDTYMILEFLGNQRAEEQAYATKGFLLWGNNNPAYNQATMGYADNSNFSKVVYSDPQQAFTTPAEMGYMESHDEERLMYKNTQYGNGAGTYSVKSLPTALQKEAAAAAVFFTVPGPKLLWQFGERGYDISINDGGRTSAKPPHWEYMADVNRLNLYNVFAKLIKLKLANPSVFNNSKFSYDFNDNNGLVKRFQIADSIAGGINVTVIANMDVTAQTRTVNFQTAGGWYNFVANGAGTGLNGTKDSFNISAATQSITLQPGEYHVYISLTGCNAVTPAAGLSVTNITTNTATLNWTNLNGLFYTVDYKQTGTSVWMNAVNNSTAGSVSASNLMAGTNYDWRVSSNCTATPSTNYVQSTFTTGFNIPAIGNLKDGYGIKISPNPVVGQVVIDYFIRGTGIVNLTLVNPLGQRLKILFSAMATPGQYQLVLPNQLNDLTNGNYFIWLEQNGKGNAVHFIKNNQ